MRAGVLPFPSEAEATAIFAPHKTFSLACMLTGLLMDTYLLVLLMLLLAYIQHPDTPWARVCVAGACAGTFAASGYQWWLASHRFAYGYGTYQPFFEATPGCSFFTHRAFLLNGRSWLLVVTSVAICLSRLACALAIKIIFASLSSARDAKFVYIPTAAWLSFSTATDALLTAAILRGLLASRTAWRTTNRLISRLVRLTLEAQIPATLSAVVYLAAFLVKTTSPVTIAVVYFQSKLYALGLLYSLNARRGMRTGGVLVSEELPSAASGAAAAAPLARGL
ncbi:uncharacterized protein COLE_07562 [Cutaneotrichosporon oleaginosum]|uniref:uncharacterized protein n=1 Tax=Cutaneotrichosporon oleaginosum TaxID=879819 RepID=UPI0013253746|nr:hypothetical protein COLE_07562 [Cutaneotrichosporon oleaginosum]